MPEPGDQASTTGASIDFAHGVERDVHHARSSMRRLMRAGVSTNTIGRPQRPP
jgi:hypothetical protein